MNTEHVQTTQHRCTDRHTNNLSLFLTLQLPPHSPPHGDSSSRRRRSGCSSQPAAEELPALQPIRPGREAGVQVRVSWTGQQQRVGQVPLLHRWATHYTQFLSDEVILFYIVRMVYLCIFFNWCHWVISISYFEYCWVNSFICNFYTVIFKFTVSDSFTCLDFSLWSRIMLCY